jgi:hypothetical protein
MIIRRLLRDSTERAVNAVEVLPEAPLQGVAVDTVLLLLRLVNNEKEGVVNVVVTTVVAVLVIISLTTSKLTAVNEALVAVVAEAHTACEAHTVVAVVVITSAVHEALVARASVARASVADVVAEVNNNTALDNNERN